MISGGQEGFQTISWVSAGEASRDKGRNRDSIENNSRVTNRCGSRKIHRVRSKSLYSFIVWPLPGERCQLPSLDHIIHTGLFGFAFRSAVDSPSQRDTTKRVSTCLKIFASLERPILFSAELRTELKKDPPFVTNETRFQLGLEDVVCSITFVRFTCVPCELGGYKEKAAEYAEKRSM